MNEYKISKHCKYVKGATASAIYDLQHGTVFSLNGDATYLLDRALEGNVDAEAEDLLQKLCYQQLINYDGFPAADNRQSKITLRYVWLELTNRCNCRCLHCYGAFGYPPTNTILHELSFEEWKRIIDVIADAGGKAIQLIGGEPLLFQRICELLDYAHDRGISSIDVFTNGTLMTPSILEAIKRTNTSVRVSLYGHDAPTHDGITQSSGSFSKLDHTLEQLRDLEIPTRIAVVLMHENQDDLEQIKAYIDKKGHRYTGFDTVRKVRHSEQLSHAATDASIIAERMMIKPSFCTSYTDFEINSHWNSCWFGKCSVSAIGDVMPCIFARDKKCGNIRSDSFVSILKNLLAFWRINKEKVEVCKDCEFRYACDDCRPLAEGETGNPFAKYPRCLYNPYEAKWTSLD